VASCVVFQQLSASHGLQEYMKQVLQLEAYPAIQLYNRAGGMGRLKEFGVLATSLGQRSLGPPFVLEYFVRRSYIPI